MAITPSSSRQQNPKKLPMEEMRLIGVSLASGILDENDEAVYIILENLVERYMNVIFEWLYKVDHTSLGHTISIYCAEGKAQPPEHSYVTPYYKLAKYKNLDHMGVMVLRDLIYMFERANSDMSKDMMYKDYASFRTLEDATYLELMEEV